MKSLFIVGGTMLWLVTALGMRPSVAMAASGGHELLAASTPIQLVPETPFPGYDKTQTIDNNGIATYIRAIFIYFIWTVGIMATVMIVYGGIRWVAAAGNAARINDARGTINNALIGLIIALTSYTLLNVINPDLLNLRLPDVGIVQTLVFKNGCAQNIKCPTGYQQTLGAHCAGGNFGFISGSFQYANPGDNYCGTPGGTQYGVCCSDIATQTQCVGISSSDGSKIQGACSTVTIPTTYTACADQTPCGTIKSIGANQSCVGIVTAAPDNICYPLFSTASGSETPTGSGIAIPGSSAGGSYIFTGVQKCIDAGKPSFKIYFDATLPCGTSHVGSTPDGQQSVWGTKQSCTSGQYCGLEPFGNSCELIGPRTGCLLKSDNPLP